MQKILFKTGWLLATIAVTAACGTKESDNSNLEPSQAISVKTMRIAAVNNAQEIVATGMLTTENEARYSFKIGGVIDKVYVNEGQSFSKGQLLASLKLAEIDAGESQLKLALEKAERDYQRIQNLFADSVATLEQLQNTKTALDVAREQLAAVSFNRQYAFIYAAASGFVVRKLANDGEVVSGGMPVLAINEGGGSEWLLKVGVSDKNWAQTEVGDTCEVVLDAYPNRTLYGKVFRKSMAADISSGSFQIEIKPVMEDLKPALGMFAKATIRTGKVNDFTAIPHEALVEADGRNAFVFIPTANNRVRKQAVRIERFSNEHVLIKSGLENATEVVLTNSPFLNENAIINIVK